MKEIILQLFQRDLEKLKIEISSYKNERKIWEISGETRLTGPLRLVGDEASRQVKNSAGNLCLHICGNLQHFIGAVLGNSGYVRNRDSEFSRKKVPVKEIVAEIELTTKVVEKTLNELVKEVLQKTYPINVLGYEMTTGFFLTHLTTHLNYHLGQINYHRRLLDD